MGRHEYTVEFRIFSRSLDPNKITQELGLIPCQIRIEGAVGPRGHIQRSMWAYDGGESSRTWEHLADGLSFVLANLWPHQKLIATYAAEAELMWWCGHFHSSFDGGPRFTPSLLQKLGDFGADLFIDTYCSRDTVADQV